MLDDSSGRVSGREEIPHPAVSFGGLQSGAAEAAAKRATRGKRVSRSGSAQTRTPLNLDDRGIPRGGGREGGVESGVKRVEGEEGNPAGTRNPPGGGVGICFKRSSNRR